MKKYLFCFGTRPEAIKMAPLIHEAKARGHRALVCITGQHREMVTPFLEFFKIQPDYDLNIMEPNQTLSRMSARILTGMEKVMSEAKPDYVVVQGDTTTTLTCALSGFYFRTPVIHIEAGLRTGDIYSPFPEEANRKLVTGIATYSFPPTEVSKENLAKEGVTKNVFVTGNTSIDSLRMTVEKLKDSDLEKTLEDKYTKVDFSKKVILATVHRRENHGQPLENICKALLKIAERADVEIVLPVHLNPNVKGTVYSYLDGLNNIHLLPPLDYFDFSWFMQKSYLILTDSGGVQEEGPYFKKPVLVLRENTERPEGVTARVSRLIGNKTEVILDETVKLLDQKDLYASYASRENPYGDGYASKKIFDILDGQIT